MDLTIVERFVCPRDHAPAPLVVRADVVLNGQLVAGALGCPVCRGEWSVEAGIVQFGTLATMPVDMRVTTADAPALAAMLDLAEPGRLVVADGIPGEIASALARDFGARIVALDPADAGDYAAAIDGAMRVPLSAGSARGALLLRGARDDAFVDSALRTLAAGGRMVRGVRARVPDGASEFARDDRWWVATRDEVSAPIALRRGAR